MGEDCPGEGLHLVEHLLLRPRFSPPGNPGEAPEDVYKLIEVCLGENCQFCGEEDPYSFRISIVLPYWHERFKAAAFREYFELMDRTEAPRSEEHTSELQSLISISYAVFCLNKNKKTTTNKHQH